MFVDHEELITFHVHEAVTNAKIVIIACVVTHHLYLLLLFIQDVDAGAIRYKESEGNDRNEIFGALNSFKVAILHMILCFHEHLFQDTNCFIMMLNMIKF